MFVSRDWPSFLGTPYYLKNGRSYEIQIWQIHSQGPSELKPVKNFREMGAWVYPRTAQVFWVPPIISGTEKATYFTYGKYIYRVHPNRRSWNVLLIRECGRIQGAFPVPEIKGGSPGYTFYLRNGKSYVQYIQGVHPNKSPLEILGYLGVSGDCLIFFGYLLLSQEWEKLQTSKICMHV